MFGTAVLAGVIFALTHPGNDTVKHNVYIPPFIGITVGALICGIAPLTQAGFNPARDFGPRIVAYLAGWKEAAFWWVYIVKPYWQGAPPRCCSAARSTYCGQEEGTRWQHHTIRDAILYVIYNAIYLYSSRM
jgi:hypothetical protein